MLVQKKVSIKKLTIYISIILFMVIGTGFILYQNNKLATSKLTNINKPIVFNVPTNATSTLVNNPTVVSSDQVLDINKVNQSGTLNLNIFSSDKFKNLRENTLIIREQPEIGKVDPFNPN